MSDVKNRTNDHERKAIAVIANERLGPETLETRRADSLDFHELAVWQLRAALIAAYRAGGSAAGGKA